MEKFKRFHLNLIFKTCLLGNAEVVDNDDDDDREKKQSSLLFVYQNGWQKRLLSKYGSEMVLLDAAYRTIQYALPLFFLAVKTNTIYQIVGLFVCEIESEDSITEALSILKSWNPGVKPHFAMSDNSVEEISGMENVFGECSAHAVVCELKQKLLY